MKMLDAKEIISYIANAKKSTPVKDVVITSIRVDTYGENYGKPETHEAFDINNFFNSMISY